MNARNVLRPDKFESENGFTFAFEMFAYILVKFYYSQNDKASLKYKVESKYGVVNCILFRKSVLKFIAFQDVTILHKIYSYKIVGLLMINFTG